MRNNSREGCTQYSSLCGVLMCRLPALMPEMVQMWVGWASLSHPPAAAAARCRVVLEPKIDLMK
eukprot:365720-Chlamydomonas_euryale.AAC.26